MRIKDIQECTIPVSRYADTTIPSGGLTTSLVAVITDVLREGKPVVGYGYTSIGRFGQGGLMRERFIPRLLAARPADLLDDLGSNLDPLRAWNVMMADEKPGGHGERCVAVGGLDMAIWDAAAKIAHQPLWQLLCDRLTRTSVQSPVRFYAGGGYRYPGNDVARLADEVRAFVDLGFTHAKIKIGGDELGQDLRRVEAAAAALGGSERLAVDAIYRYDLESGTAAAAALVPYSLWWFEDICDPLDFATQAQVARHYPPPIAAGEALFSLAEAKLLDTHGGLRRDHDILEFDMVHCYGLPGYLQIVDYLTRMGWPRAAFWPHGGHLFSLHVLAALGLSGIEVNPFAYQPFCGLTDTTETTSDGVDLPSAPGIGFELNRALWQCFKRAFSEL